MARPNDATGYAGKVALHAVDWAIGRAADRMMDRATKRVVRSAKTRVIAAVRPGRSTPPPIAAGVPEVRNKGWLRVPFMGTGLTRGGAIATVAAAPAFWLVADIAWAALPA